MYSNEKSKYRMNRKMAPPRINSGMHLPFRRLKNWHQSSYIRLEGTRKPNYLAQNMRKVRRKLHERRFELSSSIPHFYKRNFPKGMKKHSVPSYKRENRRTILKFLSPNLNENRVKLKVKPRNISDEFDDIFEDYEDITTISSSATQFDVERVRPNIFESGRTNDFLLNQPKSIANLSGSLENIYKGSPNQQMPVSIPNINNSFSSNAFSQQQSTSFTGSKIIPVPPPPLDSGLSYIYQKITTFNYGPGINFPPNSSTSVSESNIPPIYINQQFQPDVPRLNNNNQFQAEPGKYFVTSFGGIANVPQVVVSPSKNSNIFFQQNQTEVEQARILSTTRNATTLPQYIYDKMKKIKAIHASFETNKIIVLSLLVLSLPIIVLMIYCKYRKNKMKKVFPFKKKNAHSLLRASRQQRKDLLKQIDGIKYENLNTEVQVEP